MQGSHLARLGMPESSNELYPCNEDEKRVPCDNAAVCQTPASQKKNEGDPSGRTFKKHKLVTSLKTKQALQPLLDLFSQFIDGGGGSSS